MKPSPSFVEVASIDYPMFKIGIRFQGKGNKVLSQSLSSKA